MEIPMIDKMHHSNDLLFLSGLNFIIAMNELVQHVDASAFDDWFQVLTILNYLSIEVPSDCLLFLVLLFEYAAEIELNSMEIRRMR